MYNFCSQQFHGYYVMYEVFIFMSLTLLSFVFFSSIDSRISLYSKGWSRWSWALFQPRQFCDPLMSTLTVESTNVNSPCRWSRDLHYYSLLCDSNLTTHRFTFHNPTVGHNPKYRSIFGYTTISKDYLYKTSKCYTRQLL